MSHEERLKTVGKKLILLSKVRYGSRADPLKVVGLLSREVGLDENIAVSAIFAAQDG